MSKKEILEKSINYMENMSSQRLEEVFHFIEFLYFRVDDKQSSDMQSILLNGPTWTDDDYNYFMEQNKTFRKWRTNDLT